jgi:hypothetical protein
MSTHTANATFHAMEDFAMSAYRARQAAQVAEIHAGFPNVRVETTAEGWMLTADGNPAHSATAKLHIGCRLYVECDGQSGCINDLWLLAKQLSTHFAAKAANAEWEAHIKALRPREFLAEIKALKHAREMASYMGGHMNYAARVASIDDEIAQLRKARAV